jgi:aryl-alcohol dehydrogenase-like predicted oxidoreductase
MREDHGRFGVRVRFGAADPGALSPGFHVAGVIWMIAVGRVSRRGHLPRPRRNNIMTNANAASSGTFKIGGSTAIHRLGFGAMRITGKGIWGPPANKAECLRTLRRLPELGVNFIDTADSYGPDVSEQLIREALHPYRGMLIATKAGFQRPGPSVWEMDGRPEWLRKQALKSCKQLGVEQIGLWQLHRIDPKVPRDEQFGAIKALLDEGIIAHAGLSEVSVDDVVAASAVFPVATVQNRYNLVDRGSEDVLEHCEKHGIGFIPWYPLAAGSLAGSGGSTYEQAGTDDGADTQGNEVTGT